MKRSGRDILQSCIRAHGGHFEHRLYIVVSDICIEVHFDSHVFVRLPIVDTFVLR